MDIKTAKQHNAQQGVGECEIKTYHDPTAAELAKRLRDAIGMAVVDACVKEPRTGLLWVYVCKGFTGHYPVGVAAVVTAKSQQHAAEILNAQLRLQGLKGDATADTMTLVTQKSPEVVILCDGNY